MKRSVKPEVVLRELAEVLAGMHRPGDVHEVIYALLTAREREKIALRWQLVCMLEAGQTQRAVAKALGISLCKITRGSRELKFGPAAFRRAIQTAVGRPAGPGPRKAKRSAPAKG